jgi:bis(5'-nucleosyl)-tetraphosphatase (symmetrical)
MARYFVGDIQGCFNELKALLDKVAFNPSTDELWAVGDLVARGSQSLETLRFLQSLEDSAKVVLGNHDLHLLALHGGIKQPNPNDKLDALLQAPDIHSLVDWVRMQPLMRYLPEHKLIMTHAGVPPLWDLRLLQQEAQEVSQALQQSDYLESLIAHMYIDEPAYWNSQLIGLPRLRYCINALTRMRYVHLDGKLDFQCKLPPKDCLDPALVPWFTLDSPLKNYTRVFGHWAALMGNTQQGNLHALDTGCCWGEHLTLWHLEKNEKIEQRKLK